jgi:hypothetical protein
MLINREYMEMKSIFKRSAIGMIVLGMTGGAFAMGAMPQLNGAFIGVEALDVRPMNGDLDVFRTTYSVNNVSSFYTRAISPGYDWNWRVFGGVRFSDNDDITLSWFRLRASDSTSIYGTNTTNVVRYIGQDRDNAYGSVDFHLDEVYGVWGHTVYFNNPWSVRFAAGIEYARLDSDLYTSSADTSSLEAATSESELRGWGPRAEFDATYHFTNNFAVFANTNAALLASKREIEFNHFFADTDDTDYDYYNYTTRRTVVPKLGMRLGASYTIGFGQAGGEGAGSSLTIAAGWQVESYIHAIERVDWYESSEEGEVQSHTKVSNFSDQGLFLGLTFNTGWM